MIDPGPPPKPIGDPPPKKEIDDPGIPKEPAIS
jgi:hypothetical protein